MATAPRRCRGLRVGIGARRGSRPAARRVRLASLPLPFTCHGLLVNPWLLCLYFHDYHGLASNLWHMKRGVA